uniref:J domain-containing protein n=1 Tax=Araucaria cunninghamii TaxID=56994 RepID=A0A0D6R8G5_ARACU
MDDMKDNCFYSVLGLQKDCSASDVRCAYRKLAKKWHPDKCGANDSSGDSTKSEDAKTRFQAIQEAYSVLSDNNKRLMYDAGVYDDDDNELEMSSFVGEMAAMMAGSTKEVDATEGLDELKAMFLNIIGDDGHKQHISNKRSSDCPSEKVTGIPWNDVPNSTHEFKNQDFFRSGLHSEATAVGSENSNSFGMGDDVDSQELKQMFMSMVDPGFYASVCSTKTSGESSIHKDSKKQWNSGPKSFDELVAETLFPESGISGSYFIGDLGGKSKAAVYSEGSITCTAVAGENGDGKRRKLSLEQKDANKPSSALDCTYKWSSDIFGGSFSDIEGRESPYFF